MVGMLLVPASGCGSGGATTTDRVAQSATVVVLGSPTGDTSSKATPVAQASEIATSVPTLGPNVAVSPPTPPAGPPIVPTVGRTQDIFQSGAAEIGPVVWSTAIDPASNAPTDPIDRVPIDATIFYATLPVTRIQRGTVLGATWTYNGTPLAPLQGLVRADREQLGGWVEFHLSRTDGATWTTGIYAIAVTVDGVVAHRSAVRVGDPPAP